MRVRRFYHSTSPKSLQYTIKLIGDGIKSGTGYVPLRQYAASVASRAPARDFLSQVGEIFDDFTKNRWRYVFDPRGVELVGVTGNVIYDTILGFAENAPNKGYGDCDDAAVAMGAILQNIGLPVRIATVAKPGGRSLFDHVFVQTNVPKLGWVSVDPVGYPKHGLGWTAPHSRIAFWNLNGSLINARGTFPGRLQNAFKQMTGSHLGAIEEGDNMSLQGFAESDYPDYGLAKYDLATRDDREPSDWSKYGLINFGAQLDQPLGLIDGAEVGLAMEYDEDDFVEGLEGLAGSPLIRTKMLEMDPSEIAHIRTTGRPRLGTVALADDGDVYTWAEVPGMGGFFKKLRRKIRKGVRRVRKRISKISKRMIKALPGGKYLLKIYGKVKKIGMKLTRPLKKLLGSKFGKFIGPIAALIPGAGPVVALAISGLRKAGQIKKLLKKFNVKRDPKGRPKFKSGQQAKAFQRAMTRAAKQAVKQERRRKPSRGRGRSSRRLLRRGTTAHKSRLRGLGLV